MLNPVLNQRKVELPIVFILASFCKKVNKNPSQSAGTVKPKRVKNRNSYTTNDKMWTEN